MKRQKIAPEVKEQIINRIKNDGVTVVQAAKITAYAEGTIYAWIAKKSGWRTDHLGNHQTKT